MIIHLAGGAPSTGSSLLRSLMNSHPAFIAGPETYLFAHPKLYVDWNKYKHLLLAKGFTGLKNETLFRLNGALLDKSWYGWHRDELTELLAQSPTFPIFCERYFERALRPGVGQVVEKSPINAYCFHHFLDSFPTSTVIHCVRYPYDAIASMVARDMTPYEAVSFYLFNTSFGLKVRHHDRYAEVRYEELVDTPLDVMTRLMARLGTTFEKNLIQPRPESNAEATRMKGWNYDETGAVEKGSVGRFEQSAPETRQQILQACEHIRLSDHWVRTFDLPAASMEELCRLLGYPHIPGAKTGSVLQLKKEQWQVQMGRFVRGYPNSFSNFPITIR